MFTYFQTWNVKESLEHLQNMLSRFICHESRTQINILDYEPPDVGTNKKYPALISGNKLVVVQMSGVEDIQNNDLNMVTICPGLMETEILPLLSQTEMKISNFLSMFYIENVKHNVVYRYINRECSGLMKNSHLFLF